MHARDASGRKVSLLNDDTASQQYYAVPHRLSYRTASYVTSQPFHQSLARSMSSSPHTPELLRSDSYDSQASNEPVSPMTPSMMYSEYGQNTTYATDTRSSYDDYVTDTHATAGYKRSSSFGDNRDAYEDDGTASPSAQNPKRFPCRYRDIHGCEKTFTTSGHASRHSKIHTAEKAVHCSFSGCSKKFTRADNMKQHLETHYKDKSRSSASRPSGSSRRTSSSGRSSSGSKRSDTTPLPSPGLSSGAWDTRPLNAALHSRPTAARTPSGLDTLAMAVACQEGDT